MDSKPSPSFSLTHDFTCRLEGSLSAGGNFGLPALSELHRPESPTPLSPSGGL
jgi:hypothetical protein